jgi:hypothetical protein
LNNCDLCDQRTIPGPSAKATCRRWLACSSSSSSNSIKSIFERGEHLKGVCRLSSGMDDAKHTFKSLEDLLDQDPRQAIPHGGLSLKNLDKRQGCDYKTTERSRGKVPSTCSPFCSLVRYWLPPIVLILRPLFSCTLFRNLHD